MANGTAVSHNAMEAAYERAAKIKKEQKDKPAKTSGAASLKGTDLIASILARKRAAAAIVAVREVSADAVDAYVGELDELAQIAADLRIFERAKSQGDPNAQENINALLEQQKQIRAEMRAVLADTELGGTKIAELATQRIARRDELTAFLGSLRGKKPEATDGKELAVVIGEAESAGVITKVADSGLFTWHVNRTEVQFGPGSEDATIVEGASVVAALVNSFKQLKAANHAARVSEVQKYLISTDEVEMNGQMISELTLITGDSSFEKSVTAFLRGTGSRCLVPAKHPVDGKFLGLVLMERIAEVGFKTWNYSVTKADRQEAAHFVFGYFRKGEGWIEDSRGVTKFAVAVDGDSFDLDALRNNALKTGILDQLAYERAGQEKKVQREKDAEQRRTQAAELRDITKIENPGTISDLVRGKKVTAPVSIKWYDRWMTFHLQGTDDNRFFIAAHVDGMMDRPDLKWMSQFLEPKPVRQLERDMGPAKWATIGRFNRGFERDWQLSREAAKRNAVEVSAENVDGLCALEGADGLYAVGRISYRGEHALRPTPVGYIVRRSGDTVRFDWAVPGMSEKTLWDSDGRDDLGREVKVAELPENLRLILRNVYRFWHKLGGRDNLSRVPNHLRSAAANEAADDSPAEDDEGNEPTSDAREE